MKRLICLLTLGLALLAPARADLLDRVLGASGLDGDAASVFLGGAVDAGLQALFERTRVVNPRLESPFGTALINPGMTVELRADEGSFDQARRVEEAFQRVLRVDSDQAMQQALEDRALRQLVESGLKTAFAQAGCLEALTADEIRQWSEQRKAERDNEEVRQGSLPAKGTLERPFLVVRWRWIPLAGVDFERWWQLVTTRNVIELTSQLSVSLQLADSGLTVGTIVIPVEVRAVGASSQSQRTTYGRPFVHAMMAKAAEHLGKMLAEQATIWDQVCLGRLRLQQGPQILVETKPGQPAGSILPKLVKVENGLLPRYRVFAVYQRHAILTCGQEEGLVGTNDATGQPAGSSVRVGGFEYRLNRTTRRMALVSLDGQPLAAQEAISRPDAPVTWPGMPQAAGDSTRTGAAPAPALSPEKGRLAEAEMTVDE